MILRCPSWPAQRNISIIADPPGWFTPFANSLAEKLNEAGQSARTFDTQADVAEGEIAFYLSCTGITSPQILARNLWNLVVHASELPQGRGFSPLVWQILEGKNTIPLTMITMAEDVDSGDIVMRRELVFQGHELNDEMRNTMGQAIVDMCFDFATRSTAPTSVPQNGAPSWYPRRRLEDSALDIDQSLATQFNLLRVVDNNSYPAFFDLNGYRYTLSITRQLWEEDE